MAAIVDGKLVCEFTLFDGPDTREKHTVMSKFDVIVDDSRNVDMVTDEKFEEFVEWGGHYRVTIERIG